MREVPDNQEVWLQPATQDAVVLELVNQAAAADVAAAANASVGSCAASDAARVALYYWGDLCEQNDCDAAAHPPVEMTTAPCGIRVPVAATAAALPTTASAAIGFQNIVRGRARAGAAAELMCVALAVVQLPNVATDVLLTLNRRVADDTPAARTVAVEAARDNLVRMCASIVVHDWSLFMP